MSTEVASSSISTDALNPNPSAAHIGIVAELKPELKLGETGDKVDGFLVQRENSARILIPEEAAAFFNPVQEFNRDLSVAAIRVWAERAERVKEARWRERGARADGPGGKRGKRPRGAFFFNLLSRLGFLAFSLFCCLLRICV